MLISLSAKSAPPLYHPEPQRYTGGMATTLSRIQVTQTPEPAAGLELAAKEWPGASRSELVVR